MKISIFMLSSSRMLPAIEDFRPEPVYRAISIIALIQAGVIVGGTLFVTAMCKLKGYGDGVPESFFNGAALFVRRFGWIFLLVPVGWAACAIFAARFELNRWLQRLLMVAGLGLILYGIDYYIELGFNPYIL